ncbi:MAG: hypothetical protein J4N76_06750 [Chloroflexi bacterium]|nr:hypothetical protein [Chloroflexota bacterium]MDK1045806.1 hypothetical protein [Anaerolineales bacterium]MCI0773114.1 hypothetical protein [Chloroflexota bacterium]MCI0806210.1 hypothetical protein [Chloroflexota bacterium]MCI0827442.1 hypothetical protein [Chloroflexota bacterium]
MEKVQGHPGDGAGSSTPRRDEEQARTPLPPTSPAHPTEAEDSTKQEVEDATGGEERGSGEALMESFNG